jgi:AcrR family transcriptional regulator
MRPDPLHAPATARRAPADTIRSIAETPSRDRKARETRARIADAALGLFLKQGYAETTIDQIAEVAGVSRRTVFHHFATKEAILFDHLVARREIAIQRLQERPPSEPPLASLHAVLRQLSELGYDRRLLAQIRAVLASEPQLELSGYFSAITLETFHH